MPPLAVVHHQGRRSGKAFETPVQAFRTDTGLIIGLAYTNNANWGLNLPAAGGSEISRGGRRYTCNLGVNEFIECDATRKR